MVSLVKVIDNHDKNLARYLELKIFNFKIMTLFKYLGFEI
jgi:hypothetical protein